MRGVTAGDVRVEIVRSRGGFGGSGRASGSDTVHLARGEERTVDLVVEDP